MNSIKRHTSDVKNSRYAKFRENEVLAKISEFTAISSLLSILSCAEKYTLVVSPAVHIYIPSIICFITAGASG